MIAQLVVEDSSPWQHIPKDLTEVASVGSKVCLCVIGCILLGSESWCLLHHIAPCPSHTYG